MGTSSPMLSSDAVMEAVPNRARGHGEMDGVLVLGSGGGRVGGGAQPKEAPGGKGVTLM